MWKKETRNATELRRSSQMWSFMYTQQWENSSITRVNSRAMLNSVGHFVFNCRISDCL